MNSYFFTLSLPFISTYFWGGPSFLLPQTSIPLRILLHVSLHSFLNVCLVHLHCPLLQSVISLISSLYYKTEESYLSFSLCYFQVSHLHTITGLTRVPNNFFWFSFHYFWFPFYRFELCYIVFITFYNMSLYSNHFSYKKNRILLWHYNYCYHYN